MRIGFTLLKEAQDSPLSPHFGKAKWLGIFDTDTRAMRFVRNADLTGRAVADVFAEADCTHAVFTHIGAPALEHLKAYGIQAFWGEADVSAVTLVDRLERGELTPAESSEHAPERAHRHQH
jgi:predicted Fe-Mo cluster-binding NifX family protein